VSKRRYFAIVVKWMLKHNTEPHNVTEIARDSGINAGSVSWAVRQLNRLDIVKLHRVETLDKKEKLYSINEDAAKLIVQRYLWLCSFKLLRILPKEDDEIYLDDLKNNDEFIKAIRKHALNFEEAVESLGLNKFVEVLLDEKKKPYAIRLKENLPLHYYKQKEELKEIEEPEKVYD